MVTGICVGTSPLGSIPRIYGYEVGEDQAVPTIEAVFHSRFNFMDTSNSYGSGNAERRIGKAIRNLGGLPDGFVLATKVDADKATKDFSGARVRRSIEESLERLGIDRVPLLHIHDPEYYFTNAAEAMKKGGPVEELIRIRDEGIAEHIGVAAGPIPMLIDFVKTGVFEAVLSHNRYTLLDRSALPLMQECQARGVAYLNAAPYGGGMLIKGPEASRALCLQAGQGGRAPRRPRHAPRLRSTGRPARRRGPAVFAAQSAGGIDIDRLLEPGAHCRDDCPCRASDSRGPLAGAGSPGGAGRGLAELVPPASTRAST